ncbi:MAG: isocitrate lyase/phosphoenolpyruvate mutase family protein, partial [Phocaeicola sp.]
MTERITNVSPLYLIVDAEDGYGESPINSYWTAKRLAKAGASAIMIDDTTGIRGWQRIMHGDMSSYEVTTRGEWLGKIQAALDALEGSDCMLIARTEAMYKYGIEEAIARCIEAEKLGAPMTLIIGLRNIDHCIQVNKYVKGLKMYPDVFAKNGVPDVELNDVEKLNFRLVTMHCLETAAMKGMVEYGTMNFKNQNTVYSTSHGMGDLIPKGMDPFGKMKWIDLEEKYLEMFSAK